MNEGMSDSSGNPKPLQGYDFDTGPSPEELEEFALQEEADKRINRDLESIHALGQKAGTPALSERTRKLRRSLLLVTSIGAAVAVLGVVPTQITALGVTLTAQQGDRVLFVIAALICYFEVWFFYFSRIDLAAWSADYRLAELKTRGHTFGRTFKPYGDPTRL